jgi:hypothetical protein
MYAFLTSALIGIIITTVRSHSYSDFITDLIPIFCSHIGTSLKSYIFLNYLLHIILLPQFLTIMRGIHTIKCNGLGFCIDMCFHNHLT